MASPTWWTWVWISSGSWWWIGRPGVLQFMGSQGVGRDWVTFTQSLDPTQLGTECCGVPSSTRWVFIASGIYFIHSSMPVSSSPSSQTFSSSFIFTYNPQNNTGNSFCPSQSYFHTSADSPGMGLGLGWVGWGEWAGFKAALKQQWNWLLLRREEGRAVRDPVLPKKYFCANSWLIRWDCLSPSLFPSLPPPHLQHLKGILASRTQASSFHLLLPHQGFCFTLEAARGCTRNRVPTMAFWSQNTWQKSYCAFSCLEYFFKSSFSFNFDSHD